MRDYLVVSVEMIKAIHITTTEQNTQFASHARQIQPQIGDPLAIELHASLRQIHLEIGIDISKCAGLVAGLNDFGHLSGQFFHRGIGFHNQFNVRATRAWKRAGQSRIGFDARRVCDQSVGVVEHLLGGSIPFFEWYRTDPTKTAARKSDCPHVLNVGNALELAR